MLVMGAGRKSHPVIAIRPQMSRDSPVPAILTLKKLQIDSHSQNLILYDDPKILFFKCASGIFSQNHLSTVQQENTETIFICYCFQPKN